MATEGNKWRNPVRGQYEYIGRDFHTGVPIILGTIKRGGSRAYIWTVTGGSTGESWARADAVKAVERSVAQMKPETPSGMVTVTPEPTTLTVDAKANDVDISWQLIAEGALHILIAQNESLTAEAVALVREMARAADAND